MHTAADGTELAATRFTPHGDGPFAAMLITNGWTNRHSTGNERWWSEHYAEQGYLVYAYTSRGWGKSSGEIELNGPKEVSDAREFVDLIAADPNVLLDAPGDPRVGMIGSSYGGGIQLLTAREEPRIDAIAPHNTWSDLLESLVPDDVLKRIWTSLLLASGAAEGNGIPLDGNPGMAEPGSEGPMRQLYEWYAEVTALNAPSSNMREALGNVRSLHAGELETPTFLVQGWPDTLFPASQALRTQAMLQEYGVPVRMAIADIGHGGFGTVDPAVQAYVDDWFNTTLKDRAPTLPPYPVLRHRYGQNDLVGEMQWPPAGTTLARYYLHAAGEGGLRPGFPESSTQTLLVAPAVPASCTEFSQFQSYSNEICPFGVPQTLAQWSTKPLAAAVEVTGTPRLSLTLEGDQIEGVMLFAQLQDIAPDGSVTPVLYQVTAMRDSTSTPHRRDLDLESISHEFAVGHRIGLQVATTDLAFAWSRTHGLVTLHSGGAAEAWLDVPMVPSDAHGDRIPPTVRVRGSEEARPGASFHFTVVAFDNLAMGPLEVTVGDTRLQSLSSEGILHRFQVQLPENETAAQVLLDSITATATDLVGNRATATLRESSQPEPSPGELPEPPSKKKSPGLGPVLLIGLLAALATARRRNEGSPRA